MRLRLLPLPLVALLVAGCGGGSLSADEYRDKLDAACAKLADTNAQLPERMRDENLDLDQARAIAQEAGDTFERSVRDLDPPDELQDAHQRLLDKGDDAPPDSDDPQALRRWVLEIADLYRDLGARGCEQRQRAAAEQLPAAP